MSHQATTWAIEQKAGGPAPKATLWSIANYANEHWCAWPSQKTICAESEQSPDAVQRWVKHIEGNGLVRRIPLRLAGRRSVDFFILRPSPFFRSPMVEIEPLLPRGYSHFEPVGSSQSAPENAAANDGSVRDVAADVAVNAAANATALERQQVKPLNQENQEDDDSCPRASSISEAFVLTKEIALIAGILDDDAWPPGWQTAALRVEAFLREGYTAEDLRNGARQAMANKRDGPPHTIEYFNKPWAKARGQREAPVPQPQKGSVDASSSKTRSDPDGSGASGDVGKAPFGWLSIPQGSRP